MKYEAQSVLDSEHWITLDSDIVESIALYIICTYRISDYGYFRFNTLNYAQRQSIELNLVEEHNMDRRIAYRHYMEACMLIRNDLIWPAFHPCSKE